jgi:hypothetical protein
METRICNTCRQEKLLSDFPREKRNDKWYYRPKCKLCVKKVSVPAKALYRKNNKDLLGFNKKIYYLNNSDKIKKKILSIGKKIDYYIIII